MRWAWISLLALSATCAVGTAECGLSAPVLHVTPADLDDAFAEEARLAAEVGIAQVVVEGLYVVPDAKRPVWRRDVTLEAGQCLAAIVGMSEQLTEERQLEALEIRDGAGVVLASSAVPLPSPSAKVTQTQYCASPARREAVVVHAQLQGGPAPSTLPTQLRYRVLRSGSERADTSTLRRLNRTRLGLEARRRAGAEEAAALLASRPPEPGAMTPEVPITFAGGARLLPESQAVWFVLLRAVSARSRVAQHPRVDRAWPAGAERLARPLADPDAERADRPPVHEPRIDIDGTIFRVLAAADLGDLGAPCVALRFSRHSTDFRAPVVKRLGFRATPGSPGFELVVADLPLDGLVSTDRSCPAQGLALYVVPDGDRAEYGVQVVGEAAPDGVAAAPSTYDGALAELPALVEARSRCGVGDADGCLALGTLLAAVGYPSRDAAGAARSLEAGCALGSAEACLRRGLLDGEVERAWLAQACDRGQALGCAHLGDALRLGRGGDADYAAARAAYARACRGGSTTGCVDLRALRRYLLGGGETDALGGP